MAPVAMRWKVLVALLCVCLLLSGLFLLTGGVLGAYHHEWPDDAIMKALDVSTYPKNTSDSRFLGVSLRFSYCLFYFVLGGMLLVYSVHIPLRIDCYGREFQEDIARLRRLFRRGG